MLLRFVTLICDYQQVCESVLDLSVEATIIIK